MPTGRVCIALDDTALEPDPTWTRIDDQVRVAGITIRRGRQNELDQTDTGTASILIRDLDAVFDPDNPTSPYFGQLDGKQVALSLSDPVAEEWVQQFRGVIDDYGFDIRGSEVVTDVRIECVDAFNYLAGVEFLPSTMGDAVSAQGTVVYQEEDVQSRIEHLLADAGWPSDLANIFTGNVDVSETKYDPGDSVLSAIRDAADAEFPGIANVYVDKQGRVCFHGRHARFEPDTVSDGTSWEFARWNAAHGLIADVDTDYAQIRPPLRWTRPRSRIINAALAYPRFSDSDTFFDEADMADQIAIDAASQTEFGYRSWSANDLITVRGTTTGNTAAQECRLFADYYVANYREPATRCEAVTLKSIRPDDPSGPATWAMIAGADISDVVRLRVSYPGGGPGIDADFYIEGSNMEIRPLNPDYDMVELVLNISPDTYYDTDVFS